MWEQVYKATLSKTGLHYKGKDFEELDSIYGKR
jgi:hypothetical protein